jgi:hypothetical protein
MEKFGAYDAYSDLLMDEQRLDALRAKSDALTPQEVEEKLTLFRTLSTTGHVYSALRITNTVMPPARPEPHDATADQRQAEARFTALRERPFALTPQEQRELRTLYRRFGDQPERYTRGGVTLYVGR